MTRKDIVEQKAALQRQLDEIDKAESRAHASASLTEAERERRHRWDLQRLRGLRLIDDDFTGACFDGYNEGAELLLRIILDKPDIRVRSARTERWTRNLLGQDVRLDIDADDASGNEYNVEVQRSDEGVDKRRARYHSSILDAHLLRPGDHFSDLPETFVVFITENDVLKGGRPLYRIERIIEETNEPFGDGEHIVYVNGAEKDASTALGRLMHDFFCTDPDDMYYKELADKVRYFKEDERGVEAMCNVLEDMRNEEARRTKIDDINSVMESFGVPMERAMEALKIPVAQWDMYAGLVGKRM